ncbi:MAG TPA: HAMP domain-containing sensor histidine kinase [Herpetosiphonaceae bacterium]
MQMEAFLQALAYGAAYVDQRGRLGAMNAAARELFGLGDELPAAAPLLGGTELAAGLAVERLHGGNLIRASVGALPDGFLVSYLNLSAGRPSLKYLQLVRHALIEPLTPLQGFTDLLAAERVGPLNDQQHLMLATIRTNARRMLNTVLAFNQLELLDFGLDQLEPAQVDLRELARQAAWRMDAAASERNVRIAVAEEPPLPPVWADPDKLRQVIAMLVDNACRFTRPGGQVDVTFEVDAAFARLSVSDYGAGIRADWQPLIFSRFFYGHVDMDYQGSGCSLAIASKLIDLHGGDLSFRSEECAGSTFSLALPLRRADG